MSTLQGKTGLNAAQALNLISKRVQDFVQDAPAFDDLTLLTLRFGTGQEHQEKHST